MVATILLSTENNLWSNILIIIVYIVIMGVLLLILTFFYNMIFSVVANKFGKFLGSKIKRKGIVIATELISLIVTVIFIIYALSLFFELRNNLDYFAIKFAVMLFSFLFIIFIRDSIIIEYKKSNPTYVSINYWINNQLKRLNWLRRLYLVNRFELLVKQIFSFTIILSLLVIVLTFLTELKWSHNYSHYFLVLCFIPFFFNYWVYFNRVITINRVKEEVFIRRIIMYLFILILAVSQLFIEFKFYLNDINNSNDVEIFIISGLSVLCIALDRIIKEITTDYLDYNKSKVLE
ncbi:hypothetical protein [Paenibacillus camelliae]|uniref:hypothetical protein n=1 Tax=Paenibacillus camelliae TaxID=512410 RepID=UPI00203D21E5|nr:hypothetical protein [Paenibacillus camelliae]MCM3635076.1 hypothetical protein [Paenibacillus camelliae]